MAIQLPPRLALHAGCSLIAFWVCLISAALSPLAQAQQPLSPPQQQLVALYQQAEALDKQGDLKTSIATFEKVVQQAPDVFGKEHLWTGFFMLRLAEQYEQRLALSYEQKLVESTEAYLTQALRIRHQQLGRDDVDALAVYDKLAKFYLDRFDTAKAQEIYRQSLALREAKYGANHLELTKSLDGLGRSLALSINPVEAEKYLRRGYQIRLALGAENLELANSLHEYAVLMVQDAKFDKAVSYYEQAVKIRQKQAGINDPLLAELYEEMAALYGGSDVNRPDSVQMFLTDALRIREVKWGSNHPRILQLLDSLAKEHRRKGQYKESFELLERSLGIKESQLPPNDQVVVIALDEAAIVSAFAKRWDDTARLIDRSLRSEIARTREAQETHNFGTEGAFDGFGGTRIQRLALSLPFLVESRTDYHELSAEWLLNTRGSGQRNERDRLRLARERNDAQLNTLLAELARLRNNRARATLRLPGNESEANAWFARCWGILGQESQLEIALFKSVNSNSGKDAWIALKTLADKLPQDTVIVQFAKFRKFAPNSPNRVEPWGKVHFAAWIIPPAGQGAVKAIDLGEAPPIDKLVEEVQRGIANATQRMNDQGEAVAEREMQVLLSNLGQKILDPLYAHLQPHSQWIICPDAALWFVPWCALPLKSGYVVEKHAISVQVDVPDALIPAGRNNSAPQVFADADYGVDGVTASTVDKSVQHYRIPAAARLPGTAIEAEAITVSLGKYAGTEPQVALAASADEAAVKRVARPHTLVLSTHGFFIADAALDQWDSEATEPTETAPLTQERSLFVDPLMRCGLLLSGCNQRLKKPDGEDGVLTGLEIRGLDLRGTQLVVLSACETGLGHSRSSEGVVGLRQAFQLAGAQAVAATLWQVPDRETALLMNDFFINLAAGQSKTESLRNAQLKRIQARRAKSNAAHPLYWAAWTLTGGVK